MLSEENAKELYENGQYQSAHEKYNSIKSDIQGLKGTVQEKSKQLQENRARTIKLIVIFLVIIVGAIVVYIIFKKFKKSHEDKGEYSWLYKKWRKRR